jgi:hypothetical protein
MAGPLLLTIAVVGGYFMLISMGQVLGDYAVERVLEKAVVTNQDLKADYYGGNSFDIGEFEPTVPSMLMKAPVAITAAIYRPFLWEAKNIVMLISGIESLLIMFITLRILIRLRVVGVIPMALKSPLLTFSLIFSLFFAFSVGISTSNFGSLVRYRIPVLPFFIASLYIMDFYFNKDKKKKPVEEVAEIKDESPVA